METLSLTQNRATLTDEQWDVIQDLFDCRRKRKHSIRGIIDAILYVAIEDIHWRMLPKDFAPWQTVYYYYDKWRKTGVWARVLEALPADIRRKAYFSSYVSLYPTVDLNVIQTTPQPAKASIHNTDISTEDFERAQRTYAWILREFFDSEGTPARVGM